MPVFVVLCLMPVYTMIWFMPVMKWVVVLVPMVDICKFSVVVLNSVASLSFNVMEKLIVLMLNISS